MAPLVHLAQCTAAGINQMQMLTSQIQIIQLCDTFSVVKQFTYILKSGIAEGLSWLGHYILSQWCQRVS